MRKQQRHRIHRALNTSRPKIKGSGILDIITDIGKTASNALIDYVKSDEGQKTIGSLASSAAQTASKALAGVIEDKIKASNSEKIEPAIGVSNLSPEGQKLLAKMLSSRGKKH